MSLDAQDDPPPPPAPRPTKCPKCGSRKIQVMPNPNMRAGAEIECEACGFEGEPFPELKPLP